MPKFYVGGIYADSPAFLRPRRVYKIEGDKMWCEYKTIVGWITPDPIHYHWCRLTGQLVVDGINYPSCVLTTLVGFEATEEQRRKGEGAPVECALDFYEEKAAKERVRPPLDWNKPTPFTTFKGAWKVEKSAIHPAVNHSGDLSSLTTFKYKGD